jgi:hypothetical protein
MKLGLDFHGVLDADPLFFTELASKFEEVHIVTGMSELNFQAQYAKLGFRHKIYTHFFSIEDYLVATGKKYIFDKKGGLEFDSNAWDEQKGLYCLKNSISLHIDDTERYGKYFFTPFLLYKKMEKING